MYSNLPLPESANQPRSQFFTETVQFLSGFVIRRSQFENEQIYCECLLIVHFPLFSMGLRMPVSQSASENQLLFSSNCLLRNSFQILVGFSDRRVDRASQFPTEQTVTETESPHLHEPVIEKAVN
jgi:hypothetical protein